MCQVIEVTWFIWKLSADRLIVLLDREQCSISYFLASLGSEHRKTDTHIGHQCCDQLTAVKTRYPLTSITWLYRGLRCRPIEVKYFLKLSADKLLVFKWSQAQVQFFSKFIWNMLCLCAAQLKFWLQTISKSFPTRRTLDICDSSIHGELTRLPSSIKLQDGESSKERFYACQNVMQRSKMIWSVAMPKKVENGQKPLRYRDCAGGQGKETI